MHHDVAVAKIIYSEAVAAVKAQDDNLNAYRSRALVALTAAGAFGSLLSLDEAPRSGFFWVAVVAATVGKPLLS